MLDLQYKNEQLSEEDIKVLTNFTSELYDMNNFRSDYENEWRTSEKQFDAELEAE